MLTPILPLDRLDAVLLDMDGVVTKTAILHAAAWKRLFDDFLLARLGPERFVPFDIEADYRLHVDGKPRFEGVKAFLVSRDIVIPWGSPNDPPQVGSVCGLGNRKDVFFQELLASRGVEVYETSVQLLVDIRSRQLRTGLCSSSQHAQLILSSAGILHLFDEKVDGVDVQELHLPGKPDPAMFLELARRLGVSPGRSAVIEDAIAGVQAGKAGGFAVVVGVNRSGMVGELARRGADIEVSDLGELKLARLRYSVGRRGGPDVLTGRNSIT